MGQTPAGVPRSLDEPNCPLVKPKRGKVVCKWVMRVWLALAGAFLVYLYFSFRAAGFGPAVLRSDARVTVTSTADAITFAPLHVKRAALLFVPGALVEPTAYAPLARAVAERGHTVVVIKLSMRLASTESQREAAVSRAMEIISSGDPETRWVVAGHSAGGVVASQVAREHAGALGGLVLIGTSHPRDFDLSGLKIDVTKVSATNDGLASQAEVRANAKKLPSNTHWVTIEGGNHSQFGYYGFQLGDDRATISRADQQARTAEAICNSLDRVNSMTAR